jgi:hypothetical protein
MVADLAMRSAQVDGDLVSAGLEENRQCLRPKNRKTPSCSARMASFCFYCLWGFIIRPGFKLRQQRLHGCWQIIQQGRQCGLQRFGDDLVDGAMRNGGYAPQDYYQSISTSSCINCASETPKNCAMRKMRSPAGWRVPFSMRRIWV